MLVRSPIDAVNKAMFDRIKPALSCPLYDCVPMGKKMPFAALAETTDRPWKGAKNISGKEVLATVLIYSDYGGDKEVAELAGATITAAASSPLVIPDGWRVIKTDAENRIERLDGYRYAQVTFKFIIIDTKE